MTRGTRALRVDWPLASGFARLGYFAAGVAFKLKVPGESCFGQQSADFPEVHESQVTAIH